MAVQCLKRALGHLIGNELSDSLKLCCVKLAKALNSLYRLTQRYIYNHEINA